MVDHIHTDSQTRVICLEILSNRVLEKIYWGLIYERKKEKVLISQTRQAYNKWVWVRLGKYAIEIVFIEEKRCNHFKQGLHTDIRMYLTIMHIKKFLVLVKTTHSLERIKEEEYNS